MNIVEDGIKTANELLTLYDRVLDIPWNELADIIVLLDEFRTDFSAESGTLIDEIKTLMSDGIAGYSTASGNVYEWAGLVTPLLTAYTSLFSSNICENADAQNYILLRVFDDGIQKLSPSQNELHKSSISFDEAVGKFVSLNTRFEFEFEVKSEFVQSKIKMIRSGGTKFGVSDVSKCCFLSGGKIAPELMSTLESIQSFYTDWKRNVDQASKDIDKIEKLLNKDIHLLEYILTKAQETKTIVNPAHVETVIKSVLELTKNCENYREKYIKKTN